MKFYLKIFFISITAIALFSDTITYNKRSLEADIDYLTPITAESTYFKLNQTTPQAVINGSPIFEGLQFDTTPSTSNAPEGLLRWNATDGTLDLGMQGGDITMQIGQEMFMKVRNVSGTQINNGSVVYVSGRTGNRPNIYLARSDADSTSCVVGVTTHNIGSPSDGYVTTTGYVRSIKTNYSGAGDWGTTWVTGNQLYVSKTVAGQLTNVEPAPPHHSDVVGTVEIVHSSLGSILIALNRHKTLEELTDVNGTALTIAGQLPVWNQTAGYFDFNYNIADYFKLNQAAPQTVSGGVPVFSSGLTLSGAFDVTGVNSNLGFFESDLVANGAVSKTFAIKRHAAEGDTALAMYINSSGSIVYNTAGWNEWGLPSMSMLIGGDFVLDSQTGRMQLNPFYNRNIDMFDETTGNPYLSQYGYITAATAKKYIRWTVDDSTDYFTLSRQDANILGFKMDMPLLIESTQNAPSGVSALDKSNWQNALATDAIAAAKYGYIINNGSNAMGSGHAIGVIGWALDTANGKHTLYGTEGKVTGLGTAPYYIGHLGQGNFQGATCSSQIVGGMFQTSLTSDGSTPIATGVACGIHVLANVGGNVNYGLLIDGQTGTTAGIGIAIHQQQTGCMWMSDNADSTTAGGGIIFGSSIDTNLYRSAANTLKTDDDFKCARVITDAGTAAANTAPIKVASGSLMTNPEVGAVEFLTDKYYGTITTGTTRKQFAFADTDYGGFYTYNKAVSLAINTANAYHGYHLVTAGDVVTGLVNGWTFNAGRAVDANITSEANGTGGKLRIVNSAAHGLTTGDIVIITNANNAGHNKKTRITIDGTNPTTEFLCDDIAYVAGAGASAAVVDEPAYLKCTAATSQVFRASFCLSGASALANKIFKFELVQNVTDLDNIVAENTFSSTGITSISQNGLITVNTGDRIWLQCQNTTGDTTDFVVKHLQINVSRL